MEGSPKPPVKRELLLFFVIVAITGLAMGMSDSVISNFFNDAYHVTSVQRGFLELPRELPGVLCFFIIAFASSIGDVRLAIIAQALSAIGSLVLGLFTPTFALMAWFIFIQSLGNHIYFPLQDSIGMSIIGGEEVGRRAGQYSAIRTAFMMIANIIVYFGFRTGFFSFTTRIKLPFLIGAVGFVGVFALYILLHTKYKISGETAKKQLRMTVKKEYAIYYVLAILSGVHRQIMVVFGPWLLIEILYKQADTLALLGIISALLGAAFLPTIGRLADRLGSKIILFLEGLVLVAVYVVFGFMSGGFTSGTLAKVGLPVMIVFALFIFEKLTMNFGIVRTIYLKSILTDPGDLTPTLSAGLSMDHVVSIASAYLGGIVWYELGPQFVFFAAAILSLLNVAVALMIKGEVR